MRIGAPTRYSFQQDEWDNSVNFYGQEAQQFISAWCQYRSELEASTLACMEPDMIPVEAKPPTTELTRIMKTDFRDLLLFRILIAIGLFIALIVQLVMLVPVGLLWCIGKLLAAIGEAVCRCIGSDKGEAFFRNTAEFVSDVALFLLPIFLWGDD